MIYVIAYPKDNTNEDLSEKTTAPVELDEQLDVSLDSGELGYLKTEAHTAKPLAPLSKLTLISQPNQKLDARFVAFDSRALVRKDVVTTSVTDNSAVTNVSVPPLRYNHTASGEISVDGDNVGILSITGNVVRTYPRATFANGKITWSVQWRDTTKYPDNFKYVVAITYTSSSVGIYSHRLSMTEPSKLLQGVMIDGFGVAQPEDETQRSTLFEVLQNLLSTVQFDYARDAAQFALATSGNWIAAMQAIKSPEFKWNTQTSLWECLVQIGAVIDAIPRLVEDANGNLTVVTFEFVNSWDNVLETLDDGSTNVIGESVEESQYNTSLSSIVENLREGK